MTEKVAIIIWLAALVAWTVIRIPHQKRARKTKVAADKRTMFDRSVLGAATVGLSVIPLIWAATGFPAFADYAFQPWMGWLGAAASAGFLALFYASHKQLGRNWSVSLEIRDDHKLVTDGLYRYVRHPMYSSFWLWAVAQFLLLPNWVAGGAGLVGVGLLYFGRVAKEESMMRATFGAQYDDYAARTGRVIPKVL